MDGYILIIQIGGGVLALLHVLCFDRLVRAAYSRRREFWEAVGRPRGFFWAAPQTARWAHATWVATSRFWWSVLLRSHVWMKSDEYLMAQVRGFRGFYFGLWTFFVAWLVFGFLTGRLR
jgi:hypothetical protein